MLMQDRGDFQSDVVRSRITDQNEPYGRIRQTAPTLIRFILIAGLGFLSWLATYSGLTEIISANGRDIGAGYYFALALAVALLTLMIVYLLDNLFSPIGWHLKLLYAGGYVFLTIISVGFGFGFYWDFLEARSETTRSAISALQKVEGALTKGRIQLDQLQLTFDGLMAISAENAELERTVGQTCPNSPPGDGPRRRLREADGRNFKYASEFVRKRSGFIRSELTQLNKHLNRVQVSAGNLANHTLSKRAALYKEINRNLSYTLTRYNAFRKDPQLMQLRDSFLRRARKDRFDNGRGGKFYCPDPQLKIALLGAVRSIDQLPVIETVRINSVEGSNAITEAFRRLTASIYNSVSSLLPAKTSAAELSGLTARDYIPLFTALFVDLCILLISINRPVNKLQFFLNRARKAHNTQMHEILRRFHDVHDGRRSARLDVFHDVMFDIGTDLFAAVPIDLRCHPENSENEADFYAHQRRSNQARYLSTIMVALEEAGLVSRSHYVSERKARKLLKKLKSPYANSPGFRVYKFGKGAWPAIILDDILGEARIMETQQKLLPPPAPVAPPEKLFAMAIHEESLNERAPVPATSHIAESLESADGNQGAPDSFVNEKNSSVINKSFPPETEQGSGDDCNSNKNIENEVMKILSEEIKFHEEHHNEEEVPPDIEINKIARQFAHNRHSEIDEKVE